MAQADILKLALIHLNVQYKEPEANLSNLVRLNREAAEKGARVVLNTEMALAGFSFLSREDIAPYVAEAEGPALAELAAVAERYGVYVGIGFPEHDPETGIYYNSASMFGPDGTRAGACRKINAETRWACPGPADQEGTVDTPWGRLGMMICSDTYYGLMARAMALRGVDLLWVPANWPGGGLDPARVWRCRAMENGFAVAACNRTGRDRIMNCAGAISCVFDPRGRELFKARAEDSRVFMVDLPLDGRGRLPSSRRTEMMASRLPGHYRSVYLDLRMIEDLTEYHELPGPGILYVHGVVPEKGRLNMDVLERISEGADRGATQLLLLPRLPGDGGEKEALVRFSRRHGVAVCASFGGNGSRVEQVMYNAGSVTRFSPADMAGRGERPFPIVDVGPARTVMAPLDALIHPELAVAFSKQGCDMAVLSEDKVDDRGWELAGVKTIEKLAVALCAGNGSAVYTVPEGHQPWANGRPARAGCAPSPWTLR